MIQARITRAVAFDYGAGGAWFAAIDGTPGPADSGRGGWQNPVFKVAAGQDWQNPPCAISCRINPSFWQIGSFDVLAKGEQVVIGVE